MVDEKELKRFKKEVLLEDIRKELKELQAAFGKKPKEVLVDFYQKYTHPALKMKDENRKQAVALQMLKAKYAAELGAPTEVYYVRILTVHLPREFITRDTGEKRTVGVVYALGTTKDFSKTHYFVINHWDETAVQVRDLWEKYQKGEEYFQVNLAGWKEYGNVAVLSATRATAYSPVKDKEKKKLEDKWGDVEGVLTKLFKQVGLSDLEAMYSKDGRERFVFYPIVVASRKLRTKTGSQVGLYQFIDEGMSAKEITEKGGGIGVIVPPELVEYGEMSQLVVVGTINYSPTYGYGINPEVIMPKGDGIVIPLSSEGFNPEGEELSPEDEEKIVVDVEEEEEDEYEV